MDDDRDTGLVFAIPDLYASSRWLDNHEHSALLFTELRLDGTSPAAFKNSRTDTIHRP